MEYVKCKACGYIMEARKVGDKCPACGVPAKQFEPYIEKVSEKRLRILKMHIHPVIVHMPQAFAAFLTVLAVLLLLTGAGTIHDALYDTALVLAACLPLAVAVAFAAGILDGKIRFRKLTTPLLLRKMIAGAAFFVFSAAAAGLAFAAGLNGTAPLSGFLVLEAASLGAGALLGIWGTGLMTAAFPG
ncbi:MAG TPA: rubrerythrin [Treponema sp.]|nr:MAG: hypothetical protein A2001_16890 [Treponema sp. GWC1_61_84]HCM28688.1 rubrerythrin [Treponema sp.]